VGELYRRTPSSLPSTRIPNGLCKSSPGISVCHRPKVFRTSDVGGFPLLRVGSEVWDPQSRAMSATNPLLPLPRYPTASQVIPDWRRFQRWPFFWRRVGCPKLPIPIGRGSQALPSTKEPTTKYRLPANCQLLFASCFFSKIFCVSHPWALSECSYFIRPYQ
jgi:hypothetical protein